MSPPAPSQDALPSDSIPARYPNAEVASFQTICWLFLRLLGLVYLTAIVSFWVQAEGLVGSHGIAPVASLLRDANAQLDIARYWLFPTIFWLESGDGFIQLVCAAGTFFAISLFFGFLEKLSSVILWFTYVSLCVAGQEFLSFQWDALLCEAGFLAIFLPGGEKNATWRSLATPLRTDLWRPELRPRYRPEIIFLFRFLLFRLMLGSGLVKILSGDETWRTLRALDFHYLTQPLSNRIAYYLHHLPHPVQAVSTFIALAIELAFPFLIFFGRKSRHLAAGAFLFLQGLIALSGNYAFFNLLAGALCLFILDDQLLRACLTKGRKLRALTVSDLPLGRHVFRSPLAGILLVAAGIEFVSALSGRAYVPHLIESIPAWVQPFRMVNSYGLFAVMTTERNEIIIEGSNDGTEWKVYDFRWKPGNVEEPPRQVAPHQPRLDWQMWFAALSSFRHNPWFLSFVKKLLEGSPPVLSLLRENPFPEGPPKYVRALLYEYNFTRLSEKAVSDLWWKRELKGTYLPPVSLESFEPR